MSVNEDPEKQTDPALRKLNAPPAVNGPREEVYCTKVGSTHPEETYIVAGHMDGHGWGEAANDDGSGTALVMELARIFSDPNIVTERSSLVKNWYKTFDTYLNDPAKGYAYLKQQVQTNIAKL